jgi:uncharacterized membrane protein YhhN
MTPDFKFPVLKYAALLFRMAVCSTKRKSVASFSLSHFMGSHLTFTARSYTRSVSAVWVFSRLEMVCS